MVYLRSRKTHIYQRKSKNNLFCILQKSANNTANCTQFLNTEVGSKIILLVKSHYNQLFSNGQFLVFIKISFSIFYKLKCEIPMIKTETLKFCSSLVLLFRNFSILFLPRVTSLYRYML